MMSDRLTIDQQDPRSRTEDLHPISHTPCQAYQNDARELCITQEFSNQSRSSQSRDRKRYADDAALESAMPDDVDPVINLIDDGKTDEAFQLLNTSPGLTNEKSQREGALGGATLLHWAAHRDAIPLCERLIDLGAKVNADTAMWWRTPLAWAADGGRADAVELLLNRGADVNQDAFGQTSALHAVAQGGSTSGARDPEGYRRTAEILIAHGADINRRAMGDGGQTPLDDAMRKSNNAVEDVLRRCGAKMAEQIN